MFLPQWTINNLAGPTVIITMTHMFLARQNYTDTHINSIISKTLRRNRDKTKLKLVTHKKVHEQSNKTRTANSSMTRIKCKTGKKNLDDSHQVQN